MADLPQHDVVDLVTSAELEDGSSDGRRFSVVLRHEVELPDGRRLRLLDDRGWSASAMGSSDETDAGATTGPAARAATVRALDGLERDARTCVGPDEPVGGETPADVERAHWSMLAARLRAHGVEVAPRGLADAPHRVEIGATLRAYVMRHAR